MTNAKKLEASEFLLRNYNIENEKDALDLIDQLWHIIVEGKYKEDK